MFVGGARCARPFAEEAFTALAEVLTSVEEVERLHTAGEGALDRFPDPTGSVSQRMHVGQTLDSEPTQPWTPTQTKHLRGGDQRKRQRDRHRRQALRLPLVRDRKSTRLNSSHLGISYD